MSSKSSVAGIPLVLLKRKAVPYNFSVTKPLDGIEVLSSEVIKELVAAQVLKLRAEMAKTGGVLEPSVTEFVDHRNDIPFHGGAVPTWASPGRS